MQILVVGLGRCGTVSLTKWFNELFQRNQIAAQAVHEYLARECYVAFDEYYKTGNEAFLDPVVDRICQSDFNAVVGNGYATLLPYFAKANREIILIHLQRRDRSAWVASSVRNARYYPFAYKYYVPDDQLNHDDSDIPRTAAFQVGCSTIEEWSSWSLEEKFNWHYDYIHGEITKHSALFFKTLHIYTEDLNDPGTLATLAGLVAPEAINIPAVPKLNGHYFADIERYPSEHRPYAQWLLGNIDWEQAVTNPAYLASYAMNRLETWIGWCQSGRAQKLFPHNALTRQEMLLLLQETLPQLKRSIKILEKV